MKHLCMENITINYLKYKKNKPLYSLKLNKKGNNAPQITFPHIVQYLWITTIYGADIYEKSGALI